MADRSPYVPKIRPTKKPLARQWALTRGLAAHLTEHWTQPVWDRVAKLLANPPEPKEPTVHVEHQAPPTRQVRLTPAQAANLVADYLAGATVTAVAGKYHVDYDKIAFEIEFHQLPPAKVEVKEEQTRVTLFAPKSLTKMDRPERVSAVYQHACLRYVSNELTNNASIRERFGIPERNKALASRIIREALDEGMVVPYDPSAGPRSIRYVPFWADPER